MIKYDIMCASKLHIKNSLGNVKFVRRILPDECERVVKKCHTKDHFHLVNSIKELEELIWFQWNELCLVYIQFLIK